MSSSAARALAGPRQAGDDGADVDAALGVRLRVEEQFGMHHVVGRGALEVGPRHVEEVLLVQQHRGTGVVDVEEALQIGEGVGLAQRLDARVGQAQAVALRQREDQLGLERTFDVDVQLGLGHAAQQRRQARRVDAVEVDGEVVSVSVVGVGGHGGGDG